MNTLSATLSVPRLIWRVATLLGLWFIIFGVIMVVMPSHMEAGYDVTQENLKAALCSPFLGFFGFASFLGGPRPSPFFFIVSFVIILGSTALMLFRCRTVRAFWTLTAVHIIIVTVSGIGFEQFTRYINEGP